MAEISDFAAHYGSQFASQTVLRDEVSLVHDSAMKLTRRSNTLYIRKRVPRRYQPVEAREWLWISLHTDSETIARQKAPVIWAQMIEAWEAKLDGAHAEADDRMEAAKDLAARRGFRYLPAAEVARLPFEDLMRRVEKVRDTKGRIDTQEAEALLGGAPKPKITVSKALELFWKFGDPKTKGKSEDQIRRWKNPRIKAFANFIAVVGDKPIGEINRDDLEEFKAWWWDRIKEGKVSENSANKDLIHLTSTIKLVARAKSIPTVYTTDGLSFSEGKKTTRPKFSTKWIRDKLLAPGALDGLNAEARCIMLGMVNTGYRPSEGAMLTSAQIRLDGAVPYIKIEGVGRTLKSNYAERVIPLAGVSLSAFQAFPNGFPRYADNPALSDTVNKFLRENRLLETPQHSLYSLRHSFEDRMLEARTDERIRRDLMGHRLTRERYGEGASLEHLHQIICAIAL